VHIVHVVPPRDNDIIEPRDIFARAEAASTAAFEVSARLTELGQQYASLTPCRFQVHVLESSHPAKAIVQAAERLHADFVCLSNSGKSAVSRMVLGSVARAVIEETYRPVLLAQG
jgi:nucleotide-binding universal stress UspA family protein